LYSFVKHTRIQGSKKGLGAALSIAIDGPKYTWVGAQIEAFVELESLQTYTCGPGVLTCEVLQVVGELEYALVEAVVDRKRLVPCNDVIEPSVWAEVP
jgi:hypothetical protein